MNKVVITIEDGEVKFLVNDATSPMLENEDSVVRRASHVEPVNAVARKLFHTLRRRFGEYGMMAKFTRLWPCLWRVNMKPIDGPIFDLQWRKRQDAIDFEVEYLNEHFI